MCFDRLYKLYLSLLLLLLTIPTLDYDPLFIGNNVVEWLMAQVWDSDRAWLYVSSRFSKQNMCLNVFEPIIQRDIVYNLLTYMVFMNTK